MSIIGSTVSKIGDTLASGVTNTVHLQVRGSVESALAIYTVVYRGLGLVNKPTILDVKHEFASLTAITEHTTAALSVFPADSAQGHHVLGIAPKGVALCAALARTTAALKSISGPVSQEDGLDLLESYEEVQTKVVNFYPTLNTRLRSVEQGAPGLVDYGLNKLEELFQDLADALSEVLPPSLNEEKAKALHAKIQISVEGSFTHFRSLSN